MTHSFLLIGQSNAAGRGFIADAEALDTCEGRLKVLRNGLWLKMYRPVNPDRSFSGTCLMESFAKEYANDHRDVDVGIIPCADGGTKIEQWQPGEILFDNAVNCTRLAMRTSKLCGIIWHQGESNCSQNGCDSYREKFVTLMDALRKELGMPDIPIIIGGLGDYLEHYEKGESIPKYFRSINEILEKIGNEYHNCSFASAIGLGGNPDNLHFCASALKEFGIRYYNEFKKFDKNIGCTEEIGSNTERSAIELL